MTHGKSRKTRGTKREHFWRNVTRWFRETTHKKITRWAHTTFNEIYEAAMEIPAPPTGEGIQIPNKIRHHFAIRIFHGERYLIENYIPIPLNANYFEIANHCINHSMKKGGVKSRAKAILMVKKDISAAESRITLIQSIAHIAVTRDYSKYFHTGHFTNSLFQIFVSHLDLLKNELSKIESARKTHG